MAAYNLAVDSLAIAAVADLLMVIVEDSVVVFVAVGCLVDPAVV